MQSSRRIRNHSQSGFTLTEILVVVGIIGVMLLFSLPAIAERYKGYRVRTMANELSSDLRAARHTAITRRADVDFTVRDEGDSPANQYNYTNSKGIVRLVDMPEGIVITSAPASAITFERNGSLDGSAATIVLESQVSSDRIDQYTVNISIVGMVTVDYTAVAP